MILSALGTYQGTYQGTSCLIKWQKDHSFTGVTLLNSAIGAFFAYFTSFALATRKIASYIDPEQTQLRFT